VSWQACAWAQHGSDVLPDATSMLGGDYIALTWSQSPFTSAYQRQQPFLAWRGRLGSLAAKRRR